MALKAVYGRLEEIPDAFVELFSERNGQYELTGIAGMKTEADVARLRKSLADERKAHKATRETLSKWGSLDLAEVREKLDRAAALEAAAEQADARDGKQGEGATGELDDAGIEGAGIDEIVAQRLKARLAPLEEERDRLARDAEAMGAENADLRGKIAHGRINEALRKAAAEARVVGTAVEDILLQGERIFEIKEDGAIAAREGAGVAPGTAPESWLADMRAARPHWWPASSGGGARGSSGAGGFANNPFSKEGWNLTAQAQALTADRARAEQMAKAAGTTIGGPRPL